MNARAGWWLATLLAILLPDSTALACSACRDPNDPSQGAFLAGTILLSLLPLAMFLGLALYLRHCLRRPALAEREVPRVVEVALHTPPVSPSPSDPSASTSRLRRSCS